MNIEGSFEQRAAVAKGKIKAIVPRPTTSKCTTKNKADVTFNIENARWIATMLRQQFAMSSGSYHSDVIGMVLDDPYALGYVYGFAELASYHFNNRSHQDVRKDYLEYVFANFIERSGSAETIVLYTERQLENQKTKAGSNQGKRDMSDWLLTRGSKVPVGLADHLIASAA